MPLDGITAKCLAAELNSQLQEARIDKIHQPERHDIILLLRQGSRNLRLLLSANPASPRLHLTETVPGNPSQPPMFCMLLRKHLLGARLIEISTPDYERIFNLRFLTINEIGDRQEKRLVVEIMGRHSNIILLNPEGKIIDAILHIDESISRVREVMPARPYVLPPAQNKLTPRQVLDQIAAGADWLGPTVWNKGLEKSLLERLQGFSPQLCHEVAERAGLDGRTRLQQLDDYERSRLNRVTLDLMQKIDAGAFQPGTFYDHPQAVIPVDFHALELQSFAYRRQEKSLSEAMERYYLERSRQNTIKQKRQHLQRLINQQLAHGQKKLAIHQKDIEEGSKGGQYRRWGDLLLSNLHQLKANGPQVTVIDYYDPEQPQVSIPVEPGRSLAQMAQVYFRRYNKAKTRLEKARRLVETDLADLNYLESLNRALANAVDLDDFRALQQEMKQSGLSRKKISRMQDADEDVLPDLSGGQKPGRRKKTWQASSQKKAKKRKGGDEKPLPPRQYTSSDGLTILVGRNNLQNDQLTLKTAQKDDLWLHVQKMPGTHVIVRTNRQPVPEKTLVQAAEIAAWFSRAGADNQPARADGGGGHKVAVDYCPVSHVRKPAGARPGMVIYDHYQTIMVSPKDPQALV